MNHLTFAVIGIGHIGRRHAAIINQHSETELVALIDHNPEVKNHEIFPENISFFSSLEEMYKAGVFPDVVNVATPNGLHCEHAMIALQNNSHVVIEKPMGLDRRSCEEVIEFAKKVGKKVFVVKQNRYSPPAIWMKEIVESEKIGEVLMVQINCYWNRDERYYKPNNWKGNLSLDGGVLYTQFSHFIDMMYWAFGDIDNIKSTFHNFKHNDNTEFEDSGIVQFDFKKRGMGSINFSTAVWDINLESSMTVIGSKGSFKIGGQYMNEVVYCHIENYELPELLPTNPPNDYGNFKGSAANHHYVIENVIKTIQENGTATVKPEDGMKVVEIIERIYTSGNRFRN